ncbi:MAG: hypothetical protein KZQ76_13570 [Candidatus Thiodiazotropha sp. (ex Epidulcina cf. delphinae)]|nr:hypothetical protein [Candidatus Thiodiazotropha sp. (ex Epidulcina cf. delphinae)]
MRQRAKPTQRMSRRHQRGVALVVSLILLTIITLLSVSAMRNTNLETKIAVNHQFKALTFQAAESALAIVTGPDLDDLDLDIPAVVQSSANNGNVFVSVVEDADGIKQQPDIRADVDMTYEASVDPKKGQGNILFSGHQLDTVTHLYRADAFGFVNGSNTRTQNRMQVALIRQ